MILIRELRRAAKMRNLLATLAALQGITDAPGRMNSAVTQMGNNNVFMDNELGWINWNIDQR